MWGDSLTTISVGEAGEPHGPDRLAEGGAQEKGDVGWSERGRRRGLNASEWGKRVAAIEERKEGGRWTLVVVLQCQRGFGFI